MIQKCFHKLSQCNEPILWPFIILPPLKSNIFVNQRFKWCNLLNKQLLENVKKQNKKQTKDLALNSYKSKGDF